MTFALLVASIFSSLTVKMVFSFGFSSAGAASAEAAPADWEAAAGAEEAGRAISVIFKRVCGLALTSASLP